MRNRSAVVEATRIDTVAIACCWEGRASGCLTVAYFIIKDQTTYQDLGEDFYDVNRLPHLKR